MVAEKCLCANNYVEYFYSFAQKMLTTEFIQKLLLEYDKPRDLSLWSGFGRRAVAVLAIKAAEWGASPADCAVDMPPAQGLSHKNGIIGCLATGIAPLGQRHGVIGWAWSHGCHHQIRPPRQNRGRPVSGHWEDRGSLTRWCLPQNRWAAHLDMFFIFFVP